MSRLRSEVRQRKGSRGAARVEGGRISRQRVWWGRFQLAKSFLDKVHLEAGADGGEIDGPVYMLEESVPGSQRASKESLMRAANCGTG